MKIYDFRNETKNGWIYHTVKILTGGGVLKLFSTEPLKNMQTIFVAKTLIFF